jgi:hypothetical protein
VTAAPYVQASTSAARAGVLIAAPPADDHAAEVAPRLRALGIDTRQLELGRVRDEVSVVLAYGLDEPPRFALREAGRELDPSRCATIWWWRPGSFTPDEAIPSPALRQFALREYHAAFAGLWHALPARWVNDPVRQDIASRKTYQLAVARECGLAVPRTLVTNDPDDARAFLETCRRGSRLDAVQKTLTPLAEEMGFTRRIQPADLDRLDGLRCAPAILQEYVDGMDLRVVAVGGELFAMQLDASASAHPEDCRRDWEVVARTARRVDLPERVQGALRAMMDRLGLAYGAFDLRVLDDGRHVFLEVNPAGLWLYVEDATGHSITDAVVRLLAGLPPRDRS